MPPGPAPAVLGALGAAVAVALFASPAPTFRGVVARRDVGALSGAPYLAFLLQTSVWTAYGVLTRQPAPTGTNAAGLALLSTWCLLYARHAKGEARSAFAAQAAAALLLLLAFAAALAALAALRRPLVRFAGAAAAAVNTAAYASPLANARRAARARSVAQMPLPLSAAALACSALWLAYALVVRDVFIMLPNVAGVALALAQLALYARLAGTQETRDEREALRLLAAAKAGGGGCGACDGAAGEDPPTAAGEPHARGTGAA